MKSSVTVSVRVGIKHCYTKTSDILKNISAAYRGCFSTSAGGGKKITLCIKLHFTYTFTVTNPEQDISDVRYIKYT